MESEILDMLEDLSFEGDIKDEESLKLAIKGKEGGPRNLEYTKLVAWVTFELRVLCQFEEQVTPITSPDDHTSFLMEVSTFLKEMGCPYRKLTEGSLSQRLGSEENRLVLLSYLLGELQAARMISSAKPDQGLKVEMKESENAKDLKNLLIALLFPKPPSNITPKQLFTKVKDKVSDVVSKAHPCLIGKPLFNGTLSDSQWKNIEEMQEEMQSEYRMRRQMLIKRLDVTIQSFQWSDRAKVQANELHSCFRTKRDELIDEPTVSIGHLMAAREDLAVLEKTSSASVRKNTKSNLNKVIIGKVPDRGGRVTELEAPPPEMPSWTQRSAGAGGGGGGGNFGNASHGGYQNHNGNHNNHNNNHMESDDPNEAESKRGGRGNYRGGGRGGGGGGRGGFSSDRVQGSGWNQDRNRGGYNSNRGGYDNNRGGYDNNRGGYDNNRGGYDNNRGGYDKQNAGHDYRGGGGRGHDHRGGGGGGRNYDNRGGGGEQQQQQQDSRSGGYENKGGYHSRGGNRGRGRGSRDNTRY